MIKFKPIESAPKDGTIILTEVGFALFHVRRNSLNPEGHGRWISCDPQGLIFDCADYGYYECEPTVWAPVPDFSVTE
jgi:hypothetical protein